MGAEDITATSTTSTDLLKGIERSTATISGVRTTGRGTIWRMRGGYRTMTAHQIEQRWPEVESQLQALRELRVVQDTDPAMALIQFVLAAILWIVHLWSILDAAKFGPR
jgi:hypothetical protein